MKNKRTKPTPLWVVEKTVAGISSQWRDEVLDDDGKVKHPANLYEDGTFYPSNLSAYRARAKCEREYGPEGLKVRKAY